MKIMLVVLLAAVLFVTGCENQPDPDRIQAEQTQQAMTEMTQQIGMPQIINFQEKRWAKLIFELRDQSDLVTYAYAQSQVTGKFIYLGRAIGYGLPYSVQYTNPQRIARTFSQGGGAAILPQADPNGLFMPDGLDATWLMLIDEETGEMSPVYFEPTLTVSMTKFPRRLVEEWSLTEDY